MVKGWPEEVQKAVDVLWNYADDASMSGMTKTEFDVEGYECEGEKGFFLVFAMPYPKEGK